VGGESTPTDCTGTCELIIHRVAPCWIAGSGRNELDPIGPAQRTPRTATCETPRELPTHPASEASIPCQAVFPRRLSPPCHTAVAPTVTAAAPSTAL
jgi:hypothetical protein